MPELYEVVTLRYDVMKCRIQQLEQVAEANNLARLLVLTGRERIYLLMDGTSPSL